MESSLLPEWNRIASSANGLISLKLLARDSNERVLKACMACSISSSEPVGGTCCWGPEGSERACVAGLSSHGIFMLAKFILCA